MNITGVVEFISSRHLLQPVTVPGGLVPKHQLWPFIYDTSIRQSSCANVIVACSGQGFEPVTTIITTVH